MPKSSRKVAIYFDRTGGCMDSLSNFFKTTLKPNDQLYLVYSDTTIKLEEIQFYLLQNGFYLKEIAPDIITGEPQVTRVHMHRSFPGVIIPIFIKLIPNNKNYDQLVEKFWIYAHNIFIDLIVVASDNSNIFKRLLRCNSAIDMAQRILRFSVSIPVAYCTANSVTVYNY